jgi:predicted nucleic acid-binding protein
MELTGLEKIYIFVYQFDKKDIQKHNIAHEVLSKYEESIVISAQVAKEITNVMIQKIKAPPRLVYECIDALHGYHFVHVDLHCIQHAIRLVEHYSLSIWDAFIVSAARSAECTFLLSEDMQHNQTISGVTIINPFLRD